MSSPALPRPRLLLASGNAKKLNELTELCAQLGFEILSPQAWAAVGKRAPLPEVDEDGDSFLANGAKKALAALAHLRAQGDAQTSVLADDSGLCVAALEGKPGLRSARWAGVSGERDQVDAANRAKILRDLENCSQRAAWFECTLVLAGPLAEGPGCGRGSDGAAWRAFVGRTHGQLLREERGDGGFGYDPLFLSDDLKLTFAEATAEAKHAVSHRGRAMDQLAAYLQLRPDPEEPKKPLYLRPVGLLTLGEALRRTLEQELRYADQALEQALGLHPQLGSKERQAVAELHWYSLRRLDHLALAVQALKASPPPKVAQDPRTLSPKMAGFAALLTLADLDTAGQPRDSAKKGEGTALDGLAKRNPGVAATWPAAPSQLSTALRAAAYAERNLPEPHKTAMHLGFHPEFVQILDAELGQTHARAAMAYLNQRAPLTLRVHAGRGQRSQVAAELLEEGVATLAVPGLEHALWSLQPARITATRPFLEGRLEIQDEGSQRIARALAAKPGEIVIDWCAGAGGKTLALAAAMGGKGRLIACDTHPERLAECKRRAERAHISVDTRVLDRAEKPLGDLVAAADAVLVDAPCSSSGALRRNPELRWHIDRSWAERFPEQQLAILLRASQHVKAGGRLVYATCSLLRRENEGVVSAFLAASPGFTMVAEERVGPSNGAWLATHPLARFGPDGFYWCALKRGK